MRDFNIYGDTFAKVYDLFWKDFTINIGPVVCNYLREHGVPEGKVLDLCCGTGRLTQLLQDYGYDVTGLDQSAAMLDIARNRLQESTNLVVADARTFSLNQTFKAIVSTFDSLNHLASDDDLYACFRQVFSHLEVGGIFLFDFNTELALRKWDFIDIDNTEQATFVTQGKYDRVNKRAYSKVIGFLKRENGMYEKFEEIMTNRIIDPAQIQQMLQDTGFVTVTFLDEDLLPPVTDLKDLERLVVVCTRS